MLHPLEQKIVALRRRVRRMAVLYGLSAVAAAVLACMVLLGLVDYLVRFQDRGLRIIASLAVLGVSVWAAYRYLFVAWKMRLGDVDLAVRVQRRFPHFDDRLLSAVEFLHQAEDDPTAGSAALRRAVIAQTTAESEPFDFAEVLDRRPARRAAMLFAAVCMAAGLLVVLDPLASRMAVARLVNPLGKHRLAAEDPPGGSAAGGARGPRPDVRDRGRRRQGGRLPSEVAHPLSLRGPDGAMTEESERMRFADGAMVARRENVLRPFSYRVEGGDDHSMPWTDVEVVDPPAVESLAIRLVPAGLHRLALGAVGQAHPGPGGHADRVRRPRHETAGVGVALVRRWPEVSRQVSDDGFEFTLPAPVPRRSKSRSRARIGSS